jgi:hypothetical protein
VNYGVNRLLLKMNFCTDKKISVFWLIVGQWNRKVKGKYVALSRYVIMRTVEKIMSRNLYNLFSDPLN